MASFLFSPYFPLTSTIFEGKFLLAAALLNVATWVRLVPFWFDQSQTQIVWVHIAQILNAISGFFLCSLCAACSERYVPKRERGAVTSFIFMSLSLGNLFNFSVAPSIFPHCSDFKYYLFSVACTAVIPFLFLLIYFPPPVSCPNEKKDTVVEYTWANFRGIIFVGLVWSLQNGVRNAWSPAIPDLLESFSERDKDFLASALQGSSVLGLFFIAAVLYPEKLRQRKRGLLLLISLFILIFICIFTFSLPSIFWQNPPLPQSYRFILIIGSILGFCLGQANSLCLELGKEVSSNLDPEYSGFILVMFYNISCSAFLFIPAGFLRMRMNIIISITCFLGLLFSLIVFRIPKNKIRPKERSSQYVLNST